MAACPTVATDPTYAGPMPLGQAHRYNSDTRDGGFAAAPRACSTGEPRAVALPLRGRVLAGLPEGGGPGQGHPADEAGPGVRPAPAAPAQAGGAGRAHALRPAEGEHPGGAGAHGRAEDRLTVRTHHDRRAPVPGARGGGPRELGTGNGPATSHAWPANPAAPRRPGPRRLLTQPRGPVVSGALPLASLRCGPPTRGEPRADSPARRSVPTGSSPPSAPAGWARSIAPTTRASAATSPSRCCPSHLAASPEVRARFEREARTISAAQPPAHLHAVRRRARGRAPTTW